jgi:HAD superfamily hydrolase (TIGR01509 family)
MRDLRAVLWDLDGTIVDSQEYHWQAWQETLGPLGIQVTHEQFLSTFGQTNATFLAEWLGEGKDRPSVQAVSEAKEAVFRRIILEAGLEALPGAADWIARLDKEGWRQAIASSAPRLNVEAMLRAVGLREHFQALVAAEDVTAGKPDPQVFLKAAAKLGVPPSRSIVVEDAPAGIEAARRAGMVSVGISRSRVLDADLVAPSLAQLPDGAFERLLGGGAAHKTQTPCGAHARHGVDSLKIS